LGVLVFIHVQIQESTMLSRDIGQITELLVSEKTKWQECMTSTVWGPVYIRDGMLGFFNPEFGDEYLDAFTD
jgi:hypothetical protein